MIVNPTRPCQRFRLGPPERRTTTETTERKDPARAGASADRSDGAPGAVARACSLLEALAQFRRPSTALKLARVTGQNRTSVHRTLRALSAVGFVKQSGSQYQLAESVYRLGATFLESHPFRRVALPYAVEAARRLVTDRPWIVSLTIPIGREIFVIDRLCGSNAPLEVIQDIGSRFDFSQSAAGIATLAFLDPDGAIDKIGQEQYEQLLPTLEAVRAGDGVANIEAAEQPGLYGIARCVRDPSGQPIGAIAVSGFDLDAELQANSLVHRTVARIAVQIELAIGSAAL